jgi:hypothetical protein
VYLPGYLYHHPCGEWRALVVAGRGRKREKDGEEAGEYAFAD